jgi:hypothetical protein
VTRELSDEFQAAVLRVLDDFRINPEGAEMVAVGVKRKDCLTFLLDMMEDETRLTEEWLSVLVQWSVAVGVQIERARWQTPIERTA